MHVHMHGDTFCHGTENYKKWAGSPSVVFHSLLATAIFASLPRRDAVHELGYALFLRAGVTQPGYILVVVRPPLGGLVPGWAPTPKSGFWQGGGLCAAHICAYFTFFAHIFPGLSTVFIFQKKPTSF